MALTTESIKTIKWNKYNLIGNSTGNIATGIYISDLDIQFDAGIFIGKDIGHILITHGHADHTKNIHNICLSNSKKIKIITPYFLTKLLRNFIHTFFALNSTNPLSKKITKKAEFIDIFPLSIKTTKNIIIDSFPVSHNVPCFSYGISVVSNKLKKEFASLSHTELIEIKKTTSIVEETISKEILYATDFDYKSLETLPITHYKNVIIECTFFFDEHLSEAREKLHLHWTDIKPIIETNPHINFLIIHISPRYHKEMDKIYDIIKDFKNITIF